MLETDLPAHSKKKPIEPDSKNWSNVNEQVRTASGLHFISVHFYTWVSVISVISDNVSDVSEVFARRLVRDMVSKKCTQTMVVQSEEHVH